MARSVDASTQRLLAEMKTTYKPCVFTPPPSYPWSALLTCVSSSSTSNAATATAVSSPNRTAVDIESSSQRRLSHSASAGQMLSAAPAHARSRRSLSTWDLREDEFSQSEPQQQQHHTAASFPAPSSSEPAFMRPTSASNNRHVVPKHTALVATGLSAALTAVATRGLGTMAMTHAPLLPQQQPPRQQSPPQRATYEGYPIDDSMRDHNSPALAMTAENSRGLGVHTAQGWQAVVATDGAADLELTDAITYQQQQQQQQEQLQRLHHHHHHQQQPQLQQQLSPVAGPPQRDTGFVSALEPFKGLLPRPDSAPPVDLPKLYVEGNNMNDWQIRLGVFIRFQTQLCVCLVLRFFFSFSFFSSFFLLSNCSLITRDVVVPITTT
jgi:hypothetical protein